MRHVIEPTYLAWECNGCGGAFTVPHKLAEIISATEPEGELGIVTQTLVSTCPNCSARNMRYRKIKTMDFRLL